MRYIELFAGVGGFRLGIERAFSVQPQDAELQLEQSLSSDNGEQLQRTPSCVFANEWDKYAAQTYNKNFGGQIDTRDITTISTDKIPDHDLLVGGFPCQAFSVAGKRLGFNETRGTLFFEIARILADKKPRHLLLENVKGLLSHDSGRTFQTILKVLADLGYGVEWQVLNSKDFGVPQNRERVFIVGHLGGISGRKVFPIFGSSSEAESTIHPTIDANYYKGPSNQRRMVAMTEIRTDEAKAIRRESQRAGRDFSPRRGKVLVPRADEIGNTVTATQTKEHLLSNGARIRRLTPVECERLQGFPDNWTAGVSDTQRYKQMGNAVTVNVIEAVVRRMYG